jgi:ABC-type transport system substrate-binding protein
MLTSIATNDRKKAKALIAELDRALLENGVWQANYYPSIVSVWRKNVTGFNPPVARYAGLSNVRVK